MSGIKHIRPHERFTGVVQSGSMSREAGVSPETTGSTAIWSGWVTTPAGSVSDVHHHGDCETAIYILKGRARFLFGEKLENAIEVAPGDFLFVPPFEVHQEVNLSDTEPVELIVSRGCTGILTVNVPDPRTHDHGASHSH